MADKDEGEERSRVKVVVEEEAELVEEFGREEMSFVDNEEREAIFAGQVLQGIVQLGKQAGEGVGGFYLQGE